MNVYGLDISFEQGLKMLENLLKIDAQTVKVAYFVRAEHRGEDAAELLRQELEYIDPQVVLSLAMGKQLPLREKCFQIERNEQQLKL